MPPTPHPAKGVLAMRRIQNTRVARLYGANPIYIGRVLNGHEKPPVRFKAFLADLLDMPSEELFRDEELVGDAR